MNDWNEDDNRMLRGWLSGNVWIAASSPVTANVAPQPPAKDWTKIETYWPHLVRGA